MSEQWRPVTGYEGYYEVSDQGRIRSVDRLDKQGHKQRGREKTVRKRGKYFGTTLYKDGEERFVRVHALVAEAFIGPRPSGMQVRHLDDNPDHNELSNLAYGTQADNAKDAVRNGLNHYASRDRCKNGHLLKEPNLMPSSVINGFRTCRACSREKAAAHYYARAFSQESADVQYAQIMDEMLELDPLREVVGA